MAPEWPRYSPIYVPQLPLLNLSDSERVLLAKLQQRGWRERQIMQLTRSYYRGLQVITNLRIAIPAELEFLRTVVGWPRVAVDPLVERMSVDAFRLPGATTPDQVMTDAWFDNGMDSDQTLMFTDLFSMGRSWVTVGSADSPGEAPRICVESPLNMTAIWDVRSAKPTAVLQTYWLDERRHAALYLPDQTIHVGEDDNHQWELIDRDMHGFGMVPAVRIANQASSDDRDGFAEITPEVMSITDAACRTLLGLEVAREFYSVPQKVLLGATEADFQNADGTPKSAWDTYVTRMLALERDSNGDLPTLQQLKPYDPSVFTKLIEMYASQMAGIIAANPQDLGLYTQGNPVAAESQGLVDSRRDRKARHKQRMSNCGIREVMQLVARFLNGGALPDAYRRLEVDWMDPANLNLASVTDAMAKQAEMGAVSPNSDVVRKRLGWSEVERAQIEKDLEADRAAQVEAELANALLVKEARANATVAADLKPDLAPVPAPPAV